MTWIKEEKLYPLIVLLLIWIMAARLPLDTDMWWHLRAGEETVSNHAVYRIDDFSFTRAGTEWINHSWLSQVFMYGVFRLAGFPGLSMWVAACAVGSLGLVILQMKEHPLLRGAVLLLAAVTSSVVWSPRPQIFSLVLLALTTWLVKRYRENGNWQKLFWLLPIFTLWSNLHGGYVIGLIYLGAEISGEVLDQVLNPLNSERIITRQTWVLAGFTLLSGLAVLVNPFGINMWLIPFNTVGVETLQNLISEWASPDFHQAFQQPMLWMVLGLMTALSFSRKRPAGRELLPVLVFSWAAFIARRNFGPFAIVAAPLLSSQLNNVITEWFIAARQRYAFIQNFANKSEISKRDFNPLIRNIINILLVGALVFAAGYKTYMVNQSKLVEDYESEIFPLSAVSWMNSRGLAGNLFNEYNWGGYLIYKLQDSKVFVDGRTDLFGDQVLDDYLAVIQVEDGWEKLVRTYQLDFLVLGSDSTLAKLAEDKGWEVIYKDGTAVVLLAGTIE